jgi:hypothetical protein
LKGRSFQQRRQIYKINSGVSRRSANELSAPAESQLLKKEGHHE